MTSARATDMAVPTAPPTLTAREGLWPSAPPPGAATLAATIQTRSGWRPGRVHAAVLLLNALALGVVAAGPNTLSLDLQITRAVQSLDGGLAERIAALGNWVGSSVGIGLAALALCAVLLPLRRWGDLSLVAAAVVLTRGNWVLKHLFSSPRPSATQVDVRDPASFYGFPSGHTSATVLLVGVTLVILWPLLRSSVSRLAATGVGSAVVLGVGFARIYSGAHWASDVLGGVLWGLLGVWMLVALRPVMVHRWRSRRVRQLRGSAHHSDDLARRST